MFLSSGSSIINASSITTIIKSLSAADNLPVIVGLTRKGKMLIMSNSDNFTVLDEVFSKKVIPKLSKASTLSVGDAYIDTHLIKEIFISPKTGDLLIISSTDNLLYRLWSEDYSKLESLKDSLCEVLVAYDGKKPLPKINIADYK
jgi:hypothetical protein